jgi:hypothetical protein
MSLGELVDELKGKNDPPAEAPAEPVLQGQVTPEGDIKLDSTDLNVVTARLKVVRGELADLKKEEGQLKALVLVHPDAKAGFNNGEIEIEGTITIDLEHGPLLVALMEGKQFASCCNLSLSLPKVRALAKTDPKIAAVIKTLKGRKIKVIK